MLLEGAFHAVFGVDLESVWGLKSWRWFATRVGWLLASDNPFGRHFAPEPEEADPWTKGLPQSDPLLGD